MILILKITYFISLISYRENAICNIVGYSDIGVTMNTYTHIGVTDARAELERLHLAGTSDRRNSRKIVGLK